ncbi:A/G-specific adenine glycosylase [Sporomusa malonica]|uniref:Adenine DNA glycosylase n=1 Tax=Sporomusa malonica TaxID=112901 RepID=A0A1W2C3Q7_9FIRM|nr:A/G-specific adenine glycosylase [Sporomusa malonica]SMC79803.1 A/G-specific DNA-adenine glycosylase [Sporomusa malonica]
MTLAAQLLDWYYKNARDLPWRKDKDAYKIWVSEIMLQQTRVEVVKDYYKRWMDRFPTLEILAQASEQEVLNYWQGLGYYSRARHLLSGVREVCLEYGGKVPDNPATIQRLPGVGEYTAGAIASIAYNRAAPAVDGNVLRIFSRLFCLDGDIAKSATKREIDRLIRQHIPSQCPGDFNQALMDLGAMICIPRRPRCQLCPLTNLCEAYAREVQDTLPVRATKKAPQLIVLAAAVVLRDGKYLVRQRTKAGLLAGMWEFPAIEVVEDEVAVERLKEELWNELRQAVCIKEKMSHYLHTFSHRKWDISFYQCEWLAGDDLTDKACWLSASELSTVPWAGPHYKVALLLGQKAVK